MLGAFGGIQLQPGPDWGRRADVRSLKPPSASAIAIMIRVLPLGDLDYWPRQAITVSPQLPEAACQPLSDWLTHHDGGVGPGGPPPADDSSRFRRLARGT